MSALTVRLAIELQSRYSVEAIEASKDGWAMFPQSESTVNHATASPLATGKETRSDPRTILLVEDETFVREVVTEVLQSAGYEVLAARNASEATRIYEQRCDDVALLLTDVVLPGESGRALAELLSCKSPKLKVLFVTGYPDQMRACSARHELIAKPFRASVLLEKVKQRMDDGLTELNCFARPACGSG